MVDKFSLAEQLKYHRAHNEWKAAQKKKAEGTVKEKKKPPPLEKQPLKAVTNVVAPPKPVEKKLVEVARPQTAVTGKPSAELEALRAELKQ